MKSLLPLSIIEGVSPSRVWLPPGPWETVLDYLIERFSEVEAKIWSARMEKGEVVDERGNYLTVETPYRTGACIFYYREVDSEISIPFSESVIYQDEHLLVADKPHFLPLIPSGQFLHETLLVRLRKKTKFNDLVPLHRLDRETVGVILFSINPSTRGAYASLFNGRKVKKVYQALAGRLTGFDFPLARQSRLVAGEPFFRMKEVDGKPNSETRINLVQEMNDVNLYELNALTGKKHQIRVHLSALGIPIMNDKLYPEISHIKHDDFTHPLKLLAKSICFQDPLTGKERYFESHRKL